MADPRGVEAGQLDFAGREPGKCLALASRVEPRASQAYAPEILRTACFAEHPGMPSRCRIASWSSAIRTGAGVPPGSICISPTARGGMAAAPPG